ncbi:MAG: ATP phosphoribosyltransferase regulatory subunit [Clostridia bacterium]|nr:ATP phosphoribosyltransferase regulatory subunit [Clostridia bacterium]
MIDNNILRNEEKAIFALRSLYGRYGYKPFKMSKFEEYEFYIQNKDFLVSDRIIAFNDTSGKLLALKPDVTLSIIKNGEDINGYKQKVCYNENVYRVSENTHQFKEIMQTGVECIGKIALYDINEMILMAAESLALRSDNFVLEISHLGLLSSLLDNVCKNTAFKQETIKYIADKNPHDLSRICDENNVDENLKNILLCFIAIYGERSTVLQKLDTLGEYVSKDALNTLKTLSSMLDKLSCSDKIKFDFSAVSDMNYYNGIVFKGYIKGLSQSVLTGGQYDNLLYKMGRKSGAIGFAIYLDLLEDLPDEKQDFDVDVLLLCDDTTDNNILTDNVKQIIESGKTVSVQNTDTGKIRYKELKDIRGGV